MMAVAICKLNEVCDATVHVPKYHMVLLLKLYGLAR